MLTALSKTLVLHPGPPCSVFNYHSPGNRGKSAPAGELGAWVASASRVTSGGGKGSAWSERAKHWTARARLGALHEGTMSTASSGCGVGRASAEASAGELWALALLLVSRYRRGRRVLSRSPTSEPVVFAPMG